MLGQAGGGRPPLFPVQVAVTIQVELLEGPLDPIQRGWGGGGDGGGRVLPRYAAQQTPTLFLLLSFLVDLLIGTLLFARLVRNRFPSVADVGQVQQFSLKISYYKYIARKDSSRYTINLAGPVSFCDLFQKITLTNKKIFVLHNPV